MSREKAGCRGAVNTRAALTPAIGETNGQGYPRAYYNPARTAAERSRGFSQFLKRIDYDTVGRFAAVMVTYDGRAEHYVIWCALTTLRSQLAEAGFNPR